MNALVKYCDLPWDIIRTRQRGVLTTVDQHPMETCYLKEELRCVEYTKAGNKRCDNTAGPTRDLQLTRQCIPARQ